MTRRRFTISTGVFLSLGVLTLFHRALFEAETFFGRDLLSYYRPAKILLVRLLHEAGEIPLWNPYFSFGQPFAANPEHEFFHPATTLLLLLPFEWAFRLPIILAPILAALAMLFFLRTLGRSGEAAAIGALSWGFGGYLLSTINLLPILYAVVPLPAALAFLSRAWRRGRWEDAAGLAVCGGLVGLAGEPSTLACAAVLGIVTLAAQGGRRRRGRRYVPAVAGVVLACGIAAPSLLPGLLHARLTVRAAGISPEAAGVWSFPLSRIPELLLPRFFGHIEASGDAWYWGGAFYPEQNFPFLFGIYPGLLATVLAGVSTWRRSRQLAPWTVAALGSLAIAAGPPLGIWAVLHRLPLVSGLRYPEKFLLVSCFALIVLAAAGWDLLRRVGTRRRVCAWLLAFAALTATGALALVFLSAPAGLVRPGLVPLLGGVLRRDLLLAAVTAMLSAAALGAPRRQRSLLASGVLLAELVFVGRGFVKTRPIELVRRAPPELAPIVAHPPEGPVVVLLIPSLVEPRPAEWGLATALGGDFDLTALRWSNRATELFWRAANQDAALLSPLLARRGVSALIMPRRNERGQSRIVIVPPAGPQPFAFFAPRVVPIGSDEEWVAVVRRLGPAARETACVEASAWRNLPTTPARGRVTVLERRPDRVEMRVATDGSGPGLLAINQTWAPGWRAEIDGRSAPIFRTDIDLSALAVPSGARRVTLRYTDRSVSVALALALASLLATASLVRRARRSDAAN